MPEHRSLLRRLLDEANARQQTATPPRPVPPVASPIRPEPPVSAPVPAPIIPIAPVSGSYKVIANMQTITTTEDRLQAEMALLDLRQKTGQTAADFASGSLNRAQFLSLYAHYHEKIDIIERLLARNPDTQAWQSVARPGGTRILRERYEAHVVGYGIYRYEGAAVIIEKGITTKNEAAPLIGALAAFREQPEARPMIRQLTDKAWVIGVPGKQTASLFVYTFEPAAFQIKTARDLHLNFERANRHALDRGAVQPDQFVFPHRALLETRPINRG